MTNAKTHRRWLAVSGSVLLACALTGSSRAVDVGALVEECAGCHGKDGASTAPDVPIIGGYSAEYLNGSLTRYRNKVRPCPEVKYLSGPHEGEAMDMCSVAGKLTYDNVKAIAAYLAAMPFVRANQAVDAVSAARGKQIQESLRKQCHQDGGSNPGDNVGILAGQWMLYIQQTFEEFSSGSRRLPKKMKDAFDKLTMDDRDALLNYFGSFK